MQSLGINNPEYFLYHFDTDSSFEFAHLEV